MGVSVDSAHYIEVSQWIMNFLNFLWKEDGHDNLCVRVFIAALWAIWVHRNDIVFRKAPPDPTQIINMYQNFDKRETKAIGVRQLMLRKPKGRNADFANPDTLNMIIIKGAYDSNVVVVVAVNGAWKRIRKKGFVISAVGWSICLEGRDIEDGGMRVETINAEQAEAKGLLQGIRRTIAHDVQYVTILTDCSNVIVALREFPCCN